MSTITLFFFAHQPDRLKEFAPGRLLSREPVSDYHAHFFDESLNRAIFENVAERCYLPATQMLGDMVDRFRDAPKPFKLAFGLSGTFLDQAERYRPELLDMFHDMASTGLVELTGETYYHSLAGLFDVERAEFREQAAMHRDRIHTLFGVRPTVFRNTECMYNDGIARSVQEMGFEGIMTEGVDRLMFTQGRSPDVVYHAPSGIPVLLRNYRLSDDVGYRFSEKGWNMWPLTPDKFVGWLTRDPHENVFLAMDYEIIGEHMASETGIFEFIKALPGEVARYEELEFSTPTEMVRKLKPAGELSVGEFDTISWADTEKDTSAWLGNRIQQACFEELKMLEGPVKRSESAGLIDAWRRLLTSDHLYYLATKSEGDQKIHNYFSAYGKTEDAVLRVYSAIAEIACRVAA